MALVNVNIMALWYGLVLLETLFKEAEIFWVQRNLEIRLKHVNLVRLIRKTRIRLGSNKYLL
jgi:hypothetical protein